MLKATKETLNDLYVEQGLSLEEVGARLGVCRQTVSNWLKSYGIKTRCLPPRSVQVPRASRETLVRLYVEQELSLSKVGLKFGVSTQAMLNWMRDYGIPTRTLSESWHCKTDEEKHLEKMWISGSHHRGDSRWNWQPSGTKHVYGDGYVRIKASGHPRGDWPLEHIIVMEQYLGRYLEPGEEIHHINGDKADNQIENLELFASHSEHLRAFNHVARANARKKGR